MEVSQMKIFKLFSLILIIFLVTSISDCLTVPVLKVTTTIGGTTDAPVIESIEVEQGTIDALKRPKDYPPHMPGVYVWVIKGDDMINFWTSTNYTGPGVYEFTTGFRDGKEPKSGDTLRIWVQIVDESGGYVANNETTMVWD